MLQEHLFLCGASFSHPKSSKCDEFIDILSTFWASRHVKYDRNWQIEPPRRSFWSSWRGLGDRGILGDLYFQKWAPRLDGSTIFETCTSKNGKRVTEGAYSFAWDKERAGEGVREDETRSQRKNNNALPDSFLYESLEAREQDGITAAEHESMIPWEHESTRLRGLKSTQAREHNIMWWPYSRASRARRPFWRGCILIASYNPSILTI